MGRQLALFLVVFGSALGCATAVDDDIGKVQRKPAWYDAGPDAGGDSPDGGFTPDVGKDDTATDDDTGSPDEDTGSDPDTGGFPSYDTGKPPTGGTPCLYCVGTCTTITADSACYVTCATKSKKCKWDPSSSTPCVCF